MIGPFHARALTLAATLATYCCLNVAAAQAGPTSRGQSRARLAPAADKERPPNVGSPDRGDDSIGAWVTGGVGGTNMGFAASIAADVRLHFHVVGIRHLGTLELEGGKTPTEGISELALLYGLGYFGRAWYLSIAAGPSVVWGVLRGNFLGPGPCFVVCGADQYEKHPFTVPGVAIDSQLVGHLTWFGMGFQGLANINGEVAVFGLLATVKFGTF